MDQGDRRIRSLTLHSRDDTLLVKARYCLEEAFRTASLPGLPPNAQLLVRRLDLGSIRVDQNPVLLAGRLTELLRNLAASATCVDGQSAANAEAVWFSDPLQPCKVLLLRLLDGKGLPQWYWRTLFPHRTLELNTATVGMIFAQAAATPLKGLGPARLLEEVLEPHRLARLFPCITKELARHLLREQGLDPGVGVGTASHSEGQGELRKAGVMPPVAAPDLRQPWRHAIEQAVRNWGEQDERTLWFAWHALIVHQPAWLAHREILSRIVPGAWLESWGLNQSRAAAGAVVDEVGSDLAIQGPFAPPPVVAPTAASVAAADSAAVLLLQAAGTQVISSPMHVPGVKGRAVESSCAAEVSSQNKEAGPVEAMLQLNMLKVDEIGGYEAYQPQSEVAPFSAHAGLAFVIPVLQRLGMAGLLACNERLVELDLPRQLLWSLAMRFGMAESDPLRQLFAGFEPSFDVVIAPFYAPVGWRRLVTSSGRPLNAPDGFENEDAIALHQLLKTLQLLVALYLRRHCRHSLRTLIKRPGRVVVSATHWDAIFDLNQIDLRLRRIALDNDPGWVTWLGRVVQFHYDREGERYV